MVKRETRKENMDADIIIVGGGGSGLTAAVTALERKAASIIILEKRATLGGNAIFPAGIMAVNTPLQKRLGMDTTTDEVFRHAMEFAHWKLNGALVRALVEKSADTIRWIEDKGIRFTNIVTHFPNQSPNTYHSRQTLGQRAGQDTRQVVQGVGASARPLQYSRCKAPYEEWKDIRRTGTNKGRRGNPHQCKSGHCLYGWFFR